MRKFLIRYNFILLLCAFFILPSILALIVMLGGRHAIPKWLLSDYKLGGFVKELKAVPFDLSSLNSHALQKYVEAWTANHLPMRSFFIRLNNQIFYTFFHKSHSDLVSIIVGKSRQLFEINYINAYCGLVDKEFRDQTKLTHWANQVKELHEFFAKRGQIFVYVITPSKAEYLSGAIPKRFNCDTAGVSPHTIQLAQLLTERGVPNINGSSLMVQARDQHATPMFPRGGIHWNQLGASIESNKIIELINHQLPKPLARLQFHYNLVHEPVGQDRDLLTLLNVYHPDDTYAVPKLTFQPSTANRPLTAAVIGGSFLEKMIDIFIENKTFSAVTFYRYFKLDKIKYANAKKSLKHHIDPTNNQDIESIFNADVVLLEENSEITISEHGQMLYKAMQHFQRV